MKDLSYLTLMDIYGDVLTEKQRDMLSDYYERDFSLSEIADNYGISRQAVRFCIKQAEKNLSDWEQKLGVYEFVSDLLKMMQSAKTLAKDGDAAKSIADVEDFIRSKYGTVR